MGPGELMTTKYFQDSLDEFICHGFEAFSVSCAVTVARKAAEGFIPWFSSHRDDGQCVVSLLSCSTEGEGSLGLAVLQQLNSRDSENSLSAA
jgi:hypothetical protein